MKSKPSPMEDEPIDPEDAHDRAEEAFENSGAYEFKGVKLLFSYEHEAATARLGLTFGYGDVGDFLYLLTLSGQDAAKLRTQTQKDAFFALSAQWGRKQGIRIATLTIEEAMTLTTKILEDWQASRVDPIPDRNDKPSKN